MPGKRPAVRSSRSNTCVKEGCHAFGGSARHCSPCRSREPISGPYLAAGAPARGIRCQVLGDYLDAGIGDIPGMTAEVWVESEDLALAEAILRQHPVGHT